MATVKAKVGEMGGLGRNPPKPLDIGEGGLEKGERRNPICGRKKFGGKFGNPGGKPGGLGGGCGPQRGGKYPRFKGGPVCPKPFSGRREGF